MADMPIVNLLPVHASYLILANILTGPILAGPSFLLRYTAQKTWHLV